MTAYEMRISDWSSDVCSSDLPGLVCAAHLGAGFAEGGCLDAVRTLATAVARRACNAGGGLALARDRPRRRHAPLALAPAGSACVRSEERRGGKACVSTCRSRGEPYN